jgi:hypothetical protein
MRQCKKHQILGETPPAAITSINGEVGVTEMEIAGIREEIYEN